MDTMMQLSENSRQGFEGFEAAFCRGFEEANPYIASGFTALFGADSRKETTYYIYNALGQLAAEYSNGSAAAGTSYLFTDMLGSVRTITNAAGNVTECYDYLPFGRILSSGDNGRSAAGCHPANPNDLSASKVDEKFTGQPRDNETGLDFFEARYMSAPLGRFMSPDPLMASASVYDPQSWNRYVYARNNPLRYNDPLGLYASPAYDCEDGDTACLNDEQRRILESSKIGKGKLSGIDLWNSWSESQQNAFVNNTDTLGSIVFENGTTALSLVQNVNEAFDDRTYGDAVMRLINEVSKSSSFDKANGSLHGEFSNSFKTNRSFMSQGNFQISFSQNGSFDADHDLFRNPFMHFFGEVIPNHTARGINKVFGTNLPNTTNQDAVRRMLQANPQIGITPSKDPAFNVRR
jgi:RHS repeat-associated protein